MAATASLAVYNPDRSLSDNATQFEFAWVPRPIILRVCAQWICSKQGGGRRTAILLVSHLVAVHLPELGSIQRLKHIADQIPLNSSF